MATKEKQKRTPQQKRKIAGKVLLGILIAILCIIAIITAINTICVASCKNYIKSINPVSYSSQLTPEEKNGYTTFVTDNDFRVMQLSDVHIGAGFMSVKKDNQAINAVAAMVAEEKPDLVIVTGDIAYPVPFQAGTFNNKTGAVIFASLMEKLGVYWCPAFGNHDTEAYSYFNREDISELYSNRQKYPHCLFQSGPKDVDGYGNYIVNVQTSKGEITQSFVMLDSHSYIDNDYFGIMWKYDCVHKNQVEWYEQQIKALTKINNNKTPKSLMFFHMPPQEMLTAYNEYKENGYNDTADSKYIGGKAGEKNLVVYPSEKNYGLFDKCLELGSTKGIFFGHDHLNNFTMLYKGIQLTYDYTVDYLAYVGINKYGTQRGCTMITTKPDGSFVSKAENYYQDKYTPQREKETVTMEDFYTDEEKGHK